MSDVVRVSEHPSFSDKDLHQRFELARFIESAPPQTSINASEFAAHLRVGKSTLWKFVADGLIKKPTKYGAKVSVWPVGYVRDLAREGFGGEVQHDA